MAEKLNGSGKKPRGRPRKDSAAATATSQAGGVSESEPNARGQNIIPKSKDLENLFRRLDNVHDAAESDAAEHRTDAKALYEEGANKFGCSRKVLGDLYREHRSALKREKRRNNWEASERDDMDRLCAALEGTPMGAFLRERMGEAANDTGGNGAQESPKQPAEAA